MNLQLCLLQKLDFSTMRPFLILFDSGKWNLLHVSLTLCFPKPGHPHITCHLNTFLEWKNFRTKIYIYVLFTIRFHHHETLPITFGICTWQILSLLYGTCPYYLQSETFNHPSNCEYTCIPSFHCRNYNDPQNWNMQYYTVTLYASLQFPAISTLFMQIKYNTRDFTIMLHTILSFQWSIPSSMTTLLHAILSLVFISVHEVIS